MLELLCASLLALALLAVTATALVPWDQLLQAGQSLMLSSAAVGIPLEVIYYATLGILLGRGRERPQGWQWRSFAYHGELSQRGKWLVLPFFFAGALAFSLSAIGIAIAGLGFVAALRQG